MNIILCIDDTDSLYNKSTGELAEGIAKDIEKLKFGKCSYITRHQLLIHKDIPYTSHNSAMCFKAEIKDERLEDVINYAEDYLIRESDKESDPGLCVVNLDDFKYEKELINFGYMAKRKVLTKSDAYSLAKKLNIHLSEHGGTGDGVIGALAGAGLRLSGNDGWLRGKVKVDSKNNIIKVSDICSCDNINKVKVINSGYLEESEVILLSKMIKPILINGELVLLVNKIVDDNGNIQFKTCSKENLQKYEKLKNTMCSMFKSDVEEELIDDNLLCCYNCRYRRWTKDSFVCSK